MFSKYRIVKKHTLYYIEERNFLWFWEEMEEWNSNTECYFSVSFPYFSDAQKWLSKHISDERYYESLRLEEKPIIIQYFDKNGNKIERF